jgi:hypothetical protein
MQWGDQGELGERSTHLKPSEEIFQLGFPRISIGKKKESTPETMGDNDGKHGTSQEQGAVPVEANK